MASVIRGFRWPIPIFNACFSVGRGFSAQTPFVQSFPNNSCTEAVSINRMMRGVVGNGTGALNLIGPFNTSFTPAKEVPPARCDDKFVPGELRLRVSITKKVPGALSGTLALAHVEILSDTGHIQAGNTCAVQVVP